MLLIKPYLGCNLRCQYCYERDLRSQLKPTMSYDIEAILQAIKDRPEHNDIALHGGEPLCLPKRDIERILSASFLLNKRSAIQTNGIAIDDEIIDMFKRYKTNVGISFDGPDGLSRLRMSPEQEDKVWSDMLLMKNEGISVALIAVVSKSNASKEDFPRFKRWIRELNLLGITGRINPCSGADEFALPESELKAVYLDLARYCLENDFRFSPFTDIIKRLMGDDAVCTFSGCDPFCTQSAVVVMGDGSITNCMRTNREEILIRYPSAYKTRTEILCDTPIENGGCKGCEYFKACNGGCPSAASDWRDRTDLCFLWKALFTYYGNIMKFCSTPKPASEPLAGTSPVPGKPGWSHLDSPHMDGTGRKP